MALQQLQRRAKHCHAVPKSTRTSIKLLREEQSICTFLSIAAIPKSSGNAPRVHPGSSPYIPSAHTEKASLIDAAAPSPATAPDLPPDAKDPSSYISVSESGAVPLKIQALRGGVCRKRRQEGDLNGLRPLTPVPPRQKMYMRTVD
ncbi:MAG: hypothetical protein SGPRY_006628 [Prymnesium sp.]